MIQIHISEDKFCQLYSRFACDEDGWEFTVNKEPSYPTFLHLFSPDSIVEVEVAGRGSAISYVGFGPKGD